MSEGWKAQKLFMGKYDKLIDHLVYLSPPLLFSASELVNQS